MQTAPSYYYPRKMAKRDRLPDQEKVRERLKRLLDDKDMRQVHLAALSGIQNSKLSNVFNGKDELSRNDVLKLEKATGVRSAWLENGIEPMYHPGGKAPDRPLPEKRGQRLKLYVQEHGGPTELAKRLGVTVATVIGYYGTTNPDDTTKQAIAQAYETTVEEIFESSAHAPSKQIEYMSSRFRPNRQAYVTEDVVRVVRIPVAARATFDFDQFFSDSAGEENTVEIPSSYIKRPEPHGVIEVNGDSMQNTLQSGHEVLAYVMSANDWPYAKNIVVVEFRDQFVIKRVSDNGLLTTGLLTLSSDNPAGGMFRVPKEEIRRIWQVVRNLGGPL